MVDLFTNVAKKLIIFNEITKNSTVVLYRMIHARKTHYLQSRFYCIIQ